MEYKNMFWITILLGFFTTLSNASFLGPSKLMRPQQLTLTLYYESLCPFCGSFIRTQLFKVWNEIDGEKYLNVELVPYGNAQTTMNPDGSFNITCQHGPDECTTNVLHNCALKYIYSQNYQVAFIYCTLISKYAPSSGPACAKLLQINFEPIRRCISGAEGQRLHLAAGKKTDALQPPHAGVPWILFNNIFNQAEMDEARRNLFGFICKKLVTLRLPIPEQCSHLK